jgi:hypothetical protein
VSAGEAAVVVMAVCWAVVTCFLVRVLVGLSAAQQETAQLVSALAARLEQGAGERAAAATDAVERTESPVHEISRVSPARFAVVPKELDDVEQPRAARVVGLRGPVVKVAAFGYGVRRAMTDRNPRELERRIKEEMKADRAARRAYWRKARA